MTRPLTLWVNTNTGQRLDRTALARMRDRAHVLFEANGGIFEDELDALHALGVVSLLDLEAAID